jgi:hypothetical protein
VCAGIKEFEKCLYNDKQKGEITKENLGESKRSPDIHVYIKPKNGFNLFVNPLNGHTQNNFSKIIFFFNLKENVENNN